MERAASLFFDHLGNAPTCQPHCNREFTAGHRLTAKVAGAQLEIANPDTGYHFQEVHTMKRDHVEDLSKRYHPCQTHTQKHDHCFGGRVYSFLK